MPTKLTVHEITKKRDVTSKDGTPGVITGFKTPAGEYYETFATIEVGKEYEGEIREPKDPKYARTFVIPSPKKGGGGGGRSWQNAEPKDPATIWPAWCKDIVVEGLKLGMLGWADVPAELKKLFAVFQPLYAQPAASPKPSANGAVKPAETAASAPVSSEPSAPAPAAETAKAPVSDVDQQIEALCDKTGVTKMTFGAQYKKLAAHGFDGLSELTYFANSGGHGNAAFIEQCKLLIASMTE